MIREGKLKIGDVPPYAMQHFPYWVCIVKDNGVWFLSSYRTRERAEQAVAEETRYPKTSMIVVERIEDES